MENLRNLAVWLVVFSVLQQHVAQGQDSVATAPVPVPETASGFLDFNGYYDTRDFSVMTINALARLQHGFEYFSLTNFQGAKGTSDLSGFYTEQNLRWAPSRALPLSLTAQWVIRAGDSNDNLFLGFIWRPTDMPKLAPIFRKIHLYYFTNFHLVGLSEAHSIRYLPQLEHVYRLDLLPKALPGRLYLAGFADQNISYHEHGRVSFKWVTEHQLGVMVLRHFYAVVEYRLNENLPAESQGVGFGLQYVITY
ncbi:hypothetical protein MKJ04_03705 [Pontibacter sp. E15-1]|uniref:hypothetical protein n=1 Tax=Pontibacter sp. E15-1 TaxID=2919918 RepID=UPI001F4F31FB|nr:hypothetical protein [Pontibacter sp. E15-1]MCJ8163933.1 hypothetical protein [Pontibacter sp. E15-1]